MMRTKGKEYYQKLNYENDINGLRTEFFSSCYQGQLEEIKYLCLMTSLKYHIDGHIDNGFKDACLRKHTDVAKYLCSSTDLLTHANIHLNSDEPFVIACHTSNFELIQFLLSSPLLSTHSNINADHDLGLQYLCEHRDYDIISYLIFEQSIPLTSEIQRIRQQYSFVDELFAKRELNEKLNKDLYLNPNSVSKIKI